jgi:hypothetical protein
MFMCSFNIGSFEVIRRNDGRPQNTQQRPQITQQPQQSTPSQGSNKDRQRIEAKNVDADLHSGPALGVLPSLNKGSPTKTNGNFSTPNKNGSESGGGDMSSGKLKKKKKNKQQANDVPKDIPPQYLCALSHKPMSEPVKSTYGHVYEKSSVERWFVTQGKICPFTGNDTFLRRCSRVRSHLRELDFQAVL